MLPLALTNHSPECKGIHLITDLDRPTYQLPPKSPPKSKEDLEILRVWCHVSHAMRERMADEEEVQMELFRVTHLIAHECRLCGMAFSTEWRRAEHYENYHPGFNHHLAPFPTEWERDHHTLGRKRPLPSNTTHSCRSHADPSAERSLTVDTSDEDGYDEDHDDNYDDEYDDGYDDEYDDDYDENYDEDEYSLGDDT